MKQEKKCRKLKVYCTGLQQTGALCLLQPVQGTVIRLNAKQSSHVLTTNVKYNGEFKITYKMITSTTNSTAFKDALFIRRKANYFNEIYAINQLF